MLFDVRGDVAALLYILASFNELLHH
jgi:hypothetical protein